MRSNRGRGPKNYQRSEERIREDVCDRLSDDYLIDAS
jgi:osmotically-inducible protein OsmY